MKTHSTINARTYTSLGIPFFTPVMAEKIIVFCLKDRMAIRYGVVKPLHFRLQQKQILLVECVLDIGDGFCFVTG